MRQCLRGSSETRRPACLRAAVGPQEQADRCLREAARRPDVVGEWAVPGHGQGHVLRGDGLGAGAGDGKVPLPSGRYR